MTQSTQRKKIRTRRSWYLPLRELQSKGSRTKVVGGLAGTHAARQRHQGQFFTPDPVVRFMWSVAGLLRKTDRRWGPLSILDNSFGSGRMFQLADPQAHKLVGIEIDTELAAKVRDVVREAGFRYDLECGTLEEFRLPPDSLDVALINPPFSLHLDSPKAEPFACSTYGRYGPRSAATSHRYAVAQALKWCRYVVALVPRSFADEAQAEPHFSKRLVSVFHLPPGTFRPEGAEVDVSVLAWSDSSAMEAPTVETLTELEDRVVLEVESRWRSSDRAGLSRVTKGDDGPKVTLPVTQDKTVRICHNGRRLVLKFNCGATQGRVMNAVLNEVAYSYRSKGFRLADKVRYTGQGRLDLENYLAQPDPIEAFDAFVDMIRQLGFDPEPDEAIHRYLQRRHRRNTILKAPLRHVANLTDGGLSRWIGERSKLVGVVKKQFPVRERSYGWGETPQVPVGAEIELSRSGPSYDDERGTVRWSFSYAQHHSSITQEQLVERFDFPDFEPSPNDWTVIHQGLAAQFPDEYEQVRRRALALGLDRWCSWQYQLDDLCEVALKRGHTIIGWDMGLGKARLAAALCYLGGGRHNLITVEAHLIEEMKTELRDKLGLDDDQWQVIEKPRHLEALRRINIIAYSRLKMPVDRAHPRITYAKRLRRRIHTHVCDEGHLLRNLKTAQSRAVIAVSAKHRYIMSGTPIANYPRDVLPLIQWVAGDGTATQPYGLHHPYQQPQKLEDISHAPRGIDVFRDMFVTLEWVTNEFADDLRNGAKREVPKIANVDAFRQVVAPVLKRRVMEEPEVAAHIRIPRPVTTITELDWDLDHLAYYVETARHFVNWFKDLSQWQRQNVGLIAILAKMQAVYTSANFPQAGVGDQEPYFGLTSKQRCAIERLRQLTAEGHKTIFLCHSPDIVEHLSTQLDDIDHVKFHGGITTAKRIKALDKGFRFGDAPILLATKGVLQTGYNIHQADRVLLYDRSWTPKTEQQACARVLRPQQERQVVIEYLHLEGSIDTYQAQMVECKAEAMKAGLDFGEEDPSRDFLHIETILGRFADDFEKRFGLKLDEFVDQRRRQRA